MTTNKIIPIRGTKEDWYGDKEYDQLDKKKTYAKELRIQLLGSPDFEKYESFLIYPSQKK